METRYQRAKIQDESLYYESLKHSGKLPIIGVNTFENPDAEWASVRAKEVGAFHRPEKKGRSETCRSFRARARSS
jgi:methylmalonyl-CoA mutase